MKKPRFLFCIVGVGAGNTTRNLAMLRTLEEIAPCEIRIAAQGRARELLERHYHTISLREISYSNDGAFSALSIIRNNLAFPIRFWQNMRQLRAIMVNYAPDVVVADSDFYCLRPAKRLGLKLASINNSAVIVETIRREGGLPGNCRFSYRFIERTDYWLQRRYPGMVLCPTLRELPGMPQKFVQIPPMVRPEIRPLADPGDEIVVLTGGSGIDTSRIDLRGLEGQHIRILGSRLQKVPAHAEQVGFSLDVMEHLRRAKVLVVQGGFSSVSEAVALRVPVVVLPIGNHAEQWVNGRMVEKLGLGVSCPEPGRASEAVKQVLADYPRYLHAAQTHEVRVDGHRVAAEKLHEWARHEDCSLPVDQSIPHDTLHPGAPPHQ